MPVHRVPIALTCLLSGWACHDHSIVEDPDEATPARRVVEAPEWPAPPPSRDAVDPATVDPATVDPPTPAEPDPVEPDPVEPDPVDPDPVEPPTPDPSVGQGMSWRLNRRFEAHDAVDVGCGSQPGRCDPYVGDMRCDAALPILCFTPLDVAEPAGMPEANRYHQWSGGAVDVTGDAWSPIRDGLETFADLDAICASEFGDGWRTARFHDGWGWNFRALGDLQGIKERSDRLWVLIDDQRDGNCVRR